MKKNLKVLRVKTFDKFIYLFKEAYYMLANTKQIFKADIVFSCNCVKNEIDEYNIPKNGLL